MLSGIQNHPQTGHSTVPFTTSVPGPTLAQAKPEWLRLPKPGTLCPFCGLSRTALYTLCKDGKIKSVVLRKRGASRGIRLLEWVSLFSFINSLAVEPASAGLLDTAAITRKEIP